MASILNATTSSGLVTSADNSGSLQLATNNGTTAVTIDTSQNVGIGTASPANKLDVAGIITASGSPSNPTGTTVSFYNGSGIGPTISGYQFAVRTGGTPAEAMRIDSSGNVLVGKTSQTNTGKLEIDYSRATHAGTSYNETSSSSTCTHIAFQRGGTGVGSISSPNNSSVAYNTSSDYRLKENIAPMTGALATVAALKPVTYNWKVDGSNGQGFIAHELQAVVPDCVTGEKDAVETVDDVDADGKVIGTKEVPKYQGVDTSFLVATLTAAIQELKAELDATKAEVQALKGTL